MRKKKKNGCIGCFGVLFVLLILTLVGMWTVDIFYKPNSVTNFTRRIFNKDSVEVKNDSVRIDTITLMKTDTLTVIKEQADSSIRVPIIVEQNTSYVMAKVNGCDILFCIDTGCQGVQMLTTDYQFMLNNRQITPNNLGEDVRCVYADGSEGVCKSVRIDSIEIGGIVVKDIRGTLEENTDAGRLLGHAVLSQLGHVSFDYKNKELVIKR